MIEVVVAHINTRLKTLDTFKNILELAEIIKREPEEDDDATSFPAIYCANGEYKDVSDFDYKKGVLYHRLTEPVDVVEEDEEEQVSPCDALQTHTYQMRVVGVVLKKIFGNSEDDEYITEKLANNIKNIITTENDAALNATLKTENVVVAVSGYNTDRYSIHDEEYSGMDMTVGFEFAYVAVDYTVTITGRNECFALFGCDPITVLQDISGLSCANIVHATLGLTRSQIGDCLTCQSLNDGLVQSQRDKIQRMIPIKTGLIFSFGSGDDGTTKLGRGTDFFTLDCNNAFGNLIRFTDEFGNYLDQVGAAFDKDGNSVGGATIFLTATFIDHLTVLMWKMNTETADTWLNALATAATETHATFSDWRLPNVKEYFDILNFGIGLWLNYYPFLSVGAAPALNEWTSTTAPSAPAPPNNAVTMDNGSNDLGNTVKTSLLAFRLCRNFY